MIVKFNRREVTILRRFAMMAKARNKREWFSAKDATRIVLEQNDTPPREIVKTRNAFRRLVRENLLEKYDSGNASGYSGYYRLTFYGTQFGLGNEVTRESVRPYGSITESYVPPEGARKDEVPEELKIAGEDKPPEEFTPRGARLHKSRSLDGEPLPRGAASPSKNSGRVKKKKQNKKQNKKRRETPFTKRADKIKSAKRFEELSPTAVYGKKPLRKFSKKGRPPLRYYPVKPWKRPPKKETFKEKVAAGFEEVNKTRDAVRPDSKVGMPPTRRRRRMVMANAFGGLLGVKKGDRYSY